MFYIIMPKQQWNLRFGNKGIVFTMDAMAALIIVIVLLIVSYFYMLKSIDETPNLNVARVGDDVIAILDYNKVFSTLNIGVIKNATYTILPNKYDMLIRISTSNQSPNEIISIGGEIPNDRFVGGGKRFVVIPNTNDVTFVTVRYWIWLK